jgi:chaperonin GroES
LRPAGHRILVKPDPVERTSKGGIIIPDTAADGRKYLKTTGTIVAVGPSAWEAFRRVDREGKMRNGEPWAKVGDHVHYAKNAGYRILDEETQEEYIVMQDEDVIVVKGDKVSD